jgi:hypothetical protein
MAFSLFLQWGVIQKAATLPADRLAVKRRAWRCESGRGESISKIPVRCSLKNLAAKLSTSLASDSPRNRFGEKQTFYIIIYPSP